MKKAITIAAIAGTFALTLTGCSAANMDRSSGAGSEADNVSDTSLVEVYRNADNIPNVAYFCAGEFGWASTLSNDGNSAPSLIRLPEYDSKCADQ